MKRKPYGLMADIHLHLWNAFSHTNDSNINNRLALILDEIERCAETLNKKGGSEIYIAGDVFHVRGSVSPSVLNPFEHRLEQINTKYGTKFIILPGNHDMENRDSSWVSNAITTLACDYVYTHSHEYALDVKNGIALIPWFDKIDEFKVAAKRLADTIDSATRITMDLLIHAPIDGVIPLLPDHGLGAEWLAELGFKRVFAGHYHNHKDFGNGVYSIGAIAHHTWSDVGSKAGFLIVDDDVKWFKSRCPDFVEIPFGTSEVDAALMASGNYVKARTESTKMSEIEALRKFFTDEGALGVVIQHVPPATVVRASSSVTASSPTERSSLEQSVDKFISGLISDPLQEQHKKMVAIESQKILAEATI